MSVLGLGKRLAHNCWGKTTSSLMLWPATRPTIKRWRKGINTCNKSFWYSDGIVKVFYLKSTTDLTLPITVVTLDLNKPSEGGSTFLALDSVVGTKTPSSGPSVELRLDLGRPDGRGESRCKLFRGRSSVRFFHLVTQWQAPAGFRDILGSRDWTKIPIPGFLKIKSRDFSGFDKAQQTMFPNTLIGFQTTLESFGDSKNFSKSI